MTNEPIPDDIMQAALDLAGGMLRNYDQEDYSIEVGMAIRALMAERAKWEAEAEKLLDPNCVHINMLLGTIAKPNWGQICHIGWPELDELKAELATLRAENERLRGSIKKAELDGCGRGMAIAAGIICHSFGETVQAEEILQAGAIETVEKMREAGVDAYDVRRCRPALTAIRNRRARAALKGGE